VHGGDADADTDGHRPQRLVHSRRRIVQTLRQAVLSSSIV
jgi:hypothetical protein